MKELILKEIQKLDFSIDNVHKSFELVVKEFNTEFGCGNLEVKLNFSQDLTRKLEPEIIWFEMFDNSGNTVDTNITDEEILENLNY